MKKAQFIDMVADKAEMSKSAAARVVDAIFNTASGAITDAVDAAGQLSIPGFGKFTKKTRAARTGRNPRTGIAIDIPERTSVSFTAGRGLRDRGRADAAAGAAATPRKAAAKTGTGAAKGAAAKTATAKTATKSATAKASGASGARKSR